MGIKKTKMITCLEDHTFPPEIIEVQLLLSAPKFTRIVKQFLPLE